MEALCVIVCFGLVQAGNAAEALAGAKLLSPSIAPEEWNRSAAKSNDAKGHFSEQLSEIQKLRRNLPVGAFADENDAAGRSVSIDGNRALVGVPNSSDEGIEENGEAYIFERDVPSGEWQFRFRLVASDPENSNRFGSAVSIHGDIAFVGAPIDNDNGPVSGSAYVFTFDGVSWTEAAKLTPINGASLDFFGNSISVSGHRALIGVRSGNAYVFEFNGLAWIESQELIPSLPGIPSPSTWAVSLHDDRALLAGDNVVFVFEHDGSSWTETAQLSPPPGDIESFGSALAQNANRAIIGAETDDENGPGAGAAYVFDWDGATWSSGSKITPDDGAAEQNFGQSVGLSADVVVIGADGDDDNGSTSGAAYVFEFDGVGWVQAEKLTPPAGASNDRFGWSLSLSQDLLLVGVPGLDLRGMNSGGGYAFMATATSWELDGLLAAADGGAFDQSGASVSVSGSLALVGAPQDDENGLDSGAAYVFAHDGDAWNEVQKLLPSDGEPDDGFGVSVSLSGMRAVIGSFHDDDRGPNSGSAYVFEFDGNSWLQTAKLIPEFGTGGDFFGVSVSLESSQAVIGAAGDDDLGSASGSAYVFEFDGQQWVEVDKLLPSDGNADQEFGTAVSIFGGQALIGSPSDDDNGPKSGSAYIFEDEGRSWSEVAKLTPLIGATNYSFGSSVSLAADRAFIGNNPDLPTGAAYVFEFDGSDWVETQILLPDGGAFGDFGSPVSLVGDRALVGAPGDDKNGSDSGSAYIFEYDGASWQQIDNISPGDGTAGDRFGSAVSISGDWYLVGSPFDDDVGTDSGSAYMFFPDILFTDSMETIDPN